MSNFTSTYCFLESYTYTTSYSALARQPARKKRGHKCRSGADFPISQRYIKSILDIWTFTIYSHPRWAFRGNSNMGQQGIITLFSCFLTLHAVFCDSTLPHSYALLDCNKQSNIVVNEGPKCLLSNILKLDDYLWLHQFLTLFVRYLVFHCWMGSHFPGVVNVSGCCEQFVFFTAHLKPHII